MQCKGDLLNLREISLGSDKETVTHFTIKGHSSQCSRLINLRENLLIGISPFNSRFSPDYVEALLVWGHKNFAKVDVLLPDEESAVKLLLATGRPAGKAMRKTRQELNRLRRIVVHVIEKMGALAIHSKVFHFSDFEQNPEYQSLKLATQNCYESCGKFRAACINMSAQAIRGRIGNRGRNDELLNKVNLAIPYIFAEMPFYLNSPAIMQVNSSVMAYHRLWPIGDALFSGEFSLHVDKRQGHGVIAAFEAYSV